ncbi:MAG: aspartyl/glutamyl-tRNA amidotransferase subunit C, partial [Bacteroidia bacterium]|nr:aspartyl/glutamyl-tRNA amidotransferase subunit C [Bacteroidia bacterium]
MLSKEETQHIAKLARLGLSESEIEKYQKDLSAILGYVDKLKSADIGEAAA